MQLAAQPFDLAALLFGRASAADHHGYAKPGKFGCGERRSTQFFERLHQCGSAAHGCAEGSHARHTSDGGQWFRRHVRLFDSVRPPIESSIRFFIKAFACAPHYVSRPFAHIAYVSARPQPYGQSAQYRANNAEAFHLPTSIQRLHMRTKSGHCCEARIWLPFHPANRFPRSFPSANSSRPICAMRRLPPTRPTCSTTSNASCASAAVACGFSPESNPKATKREGTAVT